MKFTVVIHEAVHLRAMRFIEAALDAGHEVPLVFFYQNGVQGADLNSHPEQVARWQILQQQRSLQLAVCIGAAARRELVDETAPNASSSRLSPAFDIVGLGQLVAGMAESDRLITFTA